MYIKCLAYGHGLKWVMSPANHDILQMVYTMTIITLSKGNGTGGGGPVRPWMLFAL